MLAYLQEMVVYQTILRSQKKKQPQMIQQRIQLNNINFQKIKYIFNGKAFVAKMNGFFGDSEI